MANQVNVKLSIEVLNGLINKNFDHAVIQYAQTNPGVDDPMPTVPTTGMTVSFANLTTPALIAVQNMDDANLVRFGPDSAGTRIPFGVLRPGRVACFEAETGLVLKMIADIAACKVRFFMLEE